MSTDKYPHYAACEICNKTTDLNGFLRCIDCQAKIDKLNRLVIFHEVIILPYSPNGIIDFSLKNK